MRGFYFNPLASERRDGIDQWRLDNAADNFNPLASERRDGIHWRRADEYLHFNPLASERRDQTIEDNLFKPCQFQSTRL